MTSQLLSSRLPELVRFATVGMLATALHLGVLWVLTDVMGVWYLAASVLGFSLAFGVSFLLQQRWTFRDQDRTRQKCKVIRFLGLQLANLVVGTVLLFGLVEWFGMWYFAAQVLVLVVLAIETYLVSRYGIFTARSTVITNQG